MDITNDMDITVDLALEQLIDLTNSDQILWERTDNQTYTQYLFSKKIDKTKKIVFRLFHQKVHDGHLLNVYMIDGGEKLTPIFSIEGTQVYELIKQIMTLKRYVFITSII